LYNCNLSCNGESRLKLEITISDTRKEIYDVLIDTGFTATSIFGLKLPLEYAQYARNLYTSSISLADTNEIPVQYVCGIVTKIEGKILKKKVPLWTFFMKGKPIIGMHFLQKCKICFDGLKNTTSIEFDFL